MLSTVLTSIISFASTNMDDIFILMILFSQTNDKKKKHDIVIGQYIGISILFMLSILGSFGLNVLPEKYMGLLGLLPIFLGIKAWIDYKRHCGPTPAHSEDTKYKETETDVLMPDDENLSVVKNQHRHEIKHKVKSFLEKIIKPEILRVVIVTVANGADNIGIYIPLFSNYSYLDFIATIIIFIFMTALWCMIGNKLSELPLIKVKIQKYKHILVPIIFIGLGMFIIAKSGTFGF